MAKQNNPVKDAVLRMFPERGRLDTGHKYMTRKTGDSEFIMIVEMHQGPSRVFRIQVNEPIYGRVPSMDVVIKNADKILEVVDLGKD